MTRNVAVATTNHNTSGCLSLTLDFVPTICFSYTSQIFGTYCAKHSDKKRIFSGYTRLQTLKMPMCMVVGCDNKTGVHQISKFRIPNLFKFTDHNSAEFKQEKERAKKWLVSLKHGFTVDTFHFTKDKIICEEHFEPHANV